jgi:hypothetical protein
MCREAKREKGVREFKGDYGQLHLILIAFHANHEGHHLELELDGEAIYP